VRKGSDWPSNFAPMAGTLHLGSRYVKYNVAMARSVKYNFLGDQAYSPVPPAAAWVGSDCNGVVFCRSAFRGRGVNIGHSIDALKLVSCDSRRVLLGINRSGPERRNSPVEELARLPPWRPRHGQRNRRELSLGGTIPTAAVLPDQCPKPSLQQFRASGRYSRDGSGRSERHGTGAPARCL
jgi:hypothetical protein